MSELEEDIRILEELLALKKKQRGNWRAEVSEIYWYVDDTGGTCEEEEQNDDIDDRYHKIGNYIRSEEEAKNSDLFI